jgi:hypothetical protein
MSSAQYNTMKFSKYKDTPTLNSKTTVNEILRVAVTNINKWSQIKEIKMNSTIKKMEVKSILALWFQLPHSPFTIENYV